MLKYFKRQKNRRHEKDVAITNEEFLANSVKRHSLRSTSSFCDEVFLEELAAAEEDVVDSRGGGYSLSSASLCAAMGTDEDIFKYHSRLSMSLSSIVTDPNCLSYFVQYLDSKKGLPLIKFYLDIENFKTAAMTQMHNEQSVQTSGGKEETQRLEEHGSPTEQEKLPCNEELEEDEYEDSNSVPELKTLCDLSMRKPLTDDEKSQIYAETNKQLTKCNNCNQNLQSTSELSLCSQSTGTNELECASAQISAASVKDAIAIYQKYLIANANQFVRLPVGIISQISLLLCKRSDDPAADLVPISTSCFDVAQLYVLEQLERDYLNEFLQSSFYCKYCIELMEGGTRSGTDTLTMFDILYSEVTLFYFMEFLEQQGERDCLDFWTTAINFRKSFNTETAPKNESTTQADAMIIYEKFFSLQSECRLWMSDKLRSRVEERICADGEVSQCFDLPLLVTAKYLEKKYLRDFLKSLLFENYVNDLRAKIEENLAIGGNSMDVIDAVSSQHKLSIKRNNKLPGHRKTMSDCTNENARDLLKHISQHNTLLATDTTHLKNLNTSGTNLNIDSRQLTNPNLLWYRSKCKDGGLKFGRVNSLGRYERDFEDIDTLNSSTKHNWSFNMSGTKIKNAMRKLVNLPEDKVQEEIAWQVAEMIVKDVTSVTLSNGDGNAAEQIL